MIRPSVRRLCTTRSATSIAIARPSPRPKTQLFIPTARPSTSTSGPPLKPGYSGAFVWIRCSISLPRQPRQEDETALMVPKVAFRLPGRPIASTIWPGLRPSTFARGIAGADNPSTLRRARSVAGSRPTRVAFEVLSSTTTVMSSSCSTTWLAVRTWPLSQTMPVPARPRRASTRTTLLLAFSTSCSISCERSLREPIWLSLLLTREVRWLDNRFGVPSLPSPGWPGRHPDVWPGAR